MESVLRYGTSTNDLRKEYRSLKTVNSVHGRLERVSILLELGKPALARIVVNSDAEVKHLLDSDLSLKQKFTNAVIYSQLRSARAKLSKLILCSNRSDHELPSILRGIDESISDCILLLSADS
jgi:hypothetical protein